MKPFSKVGKHVLRDRVARFATNEFTLDLGCGNSPLARWFPNRIGCDIGPYSGVDVVCDAHALPYRDGSFSVVLCMEVLEHLHHPQTAVAEISRVLKDGGQLILTCPFVYPVHEAPHDYQRYTEYGLRVLFGEHFDSIEISPLFSEEQTLAILIQRIVFQRDDSPLMKWFLNKIAFWLFNMKPRHTRRFQHISRTVEGEFLTAGYLLTAKKSTTPAAGGK